METTAHEHRVAVILGCIEQGLSPDETAHIFRKQAEAIHAYCDHLVSTQKTAAWLPSANTLATLGVGTVALPAILAYGAGNAAGQTAANVLTEENEVDVPTVQKADEILRLKQETSNILTRVTQRKKEESEKRKNKSVRALY